MPLNHKKGFLNILARGNPLQIFSYIPGWKHEIAIQFFENQSH